MYAEQTLRMKIQRIVEVDASGIGERIRQARENDPRSLTQLCAAVGMTTSNWYRIEKEEPKSLPESTLRKMEEVLGVDLGIKF